MKVIDNESQHSMSQNLGLMQTLRKEIKAKHHIKRKLDLELKSALKQLEMTTKDY